MTDLVGARRMIFHHLTWTIAISMVVSLAIMSILTAESLHHFLSSSCPGDLNLKLIWILCTCVWIACCTLLKHHRRHSVIFFFFFSWMHLLFIFISLFMYCAFLTISHSSFFSLSLSLINFIQAPNEIQKWYSRVYIFWVPLAPYSIVLTVLFLIPRWSVILSNWPKHKPMTLANSLILTKFAKC